tara:strand:- start:82 stop:558 length:477 start_codon:yes stop_codon:yes gene_type:complete
MNNILSKIIPLILMLMLFSCTYKPIFSEKDYNFKIDEIIFKGEKDINKEIKRGLSLIKKNTNDNKNTYNLLIETIENKIIISKDSKGDAIKFEINILAYFEITKDQKILFKNNIKKSNIYNNVSDKFKLEQNEKIIIGNLSEKISEEIISSITNLNDN